MADMKTLNTRIKLKYDLHTEWMKTENDPVLLAGEIAIAKVETAQTDPNTGVVNYVPSILMKVGDGEHKYSELGFTYARSADVADWAKAAVKPGYAASEITGIDAYIAEYVNDQMGISVDTDTQYQIVAGTTANSFKLQSKGKSDTVWADVEGSTFTVDFTAVTSRIAAVEGLHATGDDGKAKSVVAEISEAIDGLNLSSTYASKSAYDTYVASNDKAIADYKAANDKLVSANTQAIGAIKDGAVLDSFKDVEDKIGAITAATVAAEIAAAKDAAIGAATYDDTKIKQDISDAQKAADDAQAYAKGVETKLGTVAVGETLAGIVDDFGTKFGNDIEALEALHATGDDGKRKAVSVEISEAITGLDLDTTYASKEEYDQYVIDNNKAVADNTAAIKTLNEGAEVEGSVAHKVATEIATIVNENNNGSLDTLNEIAAWIINDETGAAQMSNAIANNALDITNIKDGTTLDSFKDVEDKIGVLTKETVAAEIEAAKKAAIDEATYDDTDVKADIAALEALHDVDDEGVMKSVSTEISEATTDIRAAMHTHAEGAIDVLPADKSKWDTAADRIGTADDILIFNCGTASTII